MVFRFSENVSLLFRRNGPFDRRYSSTDEIGNEQIRENDSKFLLIRIQTRKLISLSVLSFLLSFLIRSAYTARTYTVIAKNIKKYIEFRIVR